MGPPGVPTNAEGSISKAHWLLDQLKPSQQTDVLRRPAPAHRLDAGTGGLLILGKTKASLAPVAKAFAERRIHKRYRALVHGFLVEGSTGLIDAPLDGKPSESRWASVESPIWFDGAGDDAGGWVSTLDL